MDGSQATLCSGFVLTMQTVALCGDTEKQYGGTGQVLVLPRPSQHGGTSQVLVLPRPSQHGGTSQVLVLPQPSVETSALCVCFHTYTNCSFACSC